MDKSLTFYESMKYEEFIMGSGHNFIRPDFTMYSLFPNRVRTRLPILTSQFELCSSAFHIHFSLHKKYMPIHTSGRILTAKKRFQNRITDLYLVYVSCLRPSRGLSFAGLPRLFVKRWNEAESFTIYTNLQPLINCFNLCEFLYFFHQNLWEVRIPIYITRSLQL